MVLNVRKSIDYDTDDLEISIKAYHDEYKDAYKYFYFAGKSYPAQRCTYYDYLEWKL